MECGQEPSLFWRLTLREISVILEGATNRRKNDHNDRAWLAWHIEALARQKKLPKLTSLQHGTGKPKRNQTPEEIEAITRSWLSSRHRKK